MNRNFSADAAGSQALDVDRQTEGAPGSFRRGKEMQIFQLSPVFRRYMTSLLEQRIFAVSGSDGRLNNTNRWAGKEVRAPLMRPG